VTKKYYVPATPYERLLASDRVTDPCKDQLRQVFSTLDPVALLNRIREAQRNLSAIVINRRFLDFAEGGQHHPRRRHESSV
jgi:hypothetical protein